MVGDGHLSWLTGSAIDGQVVIAHPVLLKRVELRFDAKIPEFTVHETDRILNCTVACSLTCNRCPRLLLRTERMKLESAGYHPLGWPGYRSLLKSPHPNDFAIER